MCDTGVTRALSPVRTERRVTRPAMKINQRTLSAIKPGIRRIQWDDGLPGFGVRVTEGATTYVVDFKVREPTATRLARTNGPDQVPGGPGSSG